MDLTPIGSTSLTTAARAFAGCNPNDAASAVDAYLAEALRTALGDVRRAIAQATPQNAQAMQAALNRSRAARAALPDLSRMLPPELWMLVFERLDTRDLANACDASAYLGAIGLRFAPEAAIWRDGVQRSISIDLPNRRPPASAIDRFTRSPHRRDLAYSLGLMSLRVWQQPDRMDHKIAEYVTQTACPPAWSFVDTRLAWVAPSHGDNALFIADPRRLTPTRCVTTLPAGSVCSLTWSAHNPNLLAVGIDNHVSIINTRAPISVHTLIDACDRKTDVFSRSKRLLPSAIAWSRSSSHLAINTLTKLHVYDVQITGITRLVHTLDTQVHSNAHLAWQPGTRRIAVADRGVLKVWDLSQSDQPCAQQSVFDGYAGCALDSVAWSPRGNLLGVLRDQDLRVWRVKPDNGLELLRDTHIPHNFVGVRQPRLQWHPRRPDTVEITGAHNIWSYELRVEATTPRTDARH